VLYKLLNQSLHIGNVWAKLNWQACRPREKPRLRMKWVTGRKGTGREVMGLYDGDFYVREDGRHVERE
jgi:hypothetical protein